MCVRCVVRFFGRLHRNSAGILPYGKGFLGNMTENLQADCVQSRQAGFIQRFPREICNKILEQHQLTKRRLYTILKCTAFFCISSMRAACFAHCCPYSISPIRSFTTSPAMISPTTDGTKALLPGTCRRWVHLRAVPGGQMQWVLQLFAMSSFGAMGFSLE